MAVQKDKKKRKRIRFKNVCGNEEAKVDLIDLVDYLKNPNKYRSENEMQTARALAGEAGVPFLATNGASFDDGDSQNIFWMLPAVFIILGMPLSLPIMFFVYQSTSNMLSSSMFSKAQLFREWIIESITNESILYDKIYVYLRVHHRPPAPQAVCNESQPFLIDLNLTKTQDKSNTLEYLRWNMRRKKAYLFQYHESIYARLLSFHHMDAFMLMWNQRLCAVLYVLYALGRIYVMICAPMAWILNRAMNQRNDAEYYSWMDIFITFLLCIYVYFLYLFGSSGAVLLRFEYWFGFFCHKDSRMKTNGCKEMYQQMQRNRVLLNSFFPIDVVRIISQFAG
eukprot:296723_1